MRRFTLILFYILLTISCYATHNRAGEITYKHLGGLKYRVTIYTYTDVGPGVIADRPELDIHWGDGDTSILQRSNGAFENGELIGNDTKKNVYVGEHTYPGPGSYKVYMQDANRNEGVINVPSSVNIQFYIESLILISPFGTANYNSSPVLLNPPIDYNACVSQVFIHNPGAYDPDGDSLSYRLVNCKGEEGIEIPGYDIPDNVRLNPSTGDLIWETPSFIGEFNFAILIEEWRKSGNKYIRIGFVLRDLQVKVSNCPNNLAPVITTIEDTCVVANSFLSFWVSANDADANKMELTGIGGPFQMQVSPAFFQKSINYKQISSKFQWQTKCNHVRMQPYNVLFKAIDNGTPNLAGYKTVNIKIIGPPVINPNAVPMGNSILLSWEKNTCSEVVKYKIYKKNDRYGFMPGYCETGVPDYTGYALIDSLTGLDNTKYRDDNKGKGLVPGIEYCYLVVSVFPDGSESIASTETCTKLKNDVPVITNVSIEKTNATDGIVKVAWSKPKELDTTQHRGPYRYLIYHDDENISSNADLIDSSLTGLNDTNYLHSKINTLDKSHFYRIDLYNVDPLNRYKIGSSYYAPSIYLNLTPLSNGQTLKLSWNNDTPWKNKGFVIYKKNNQTTVFDSIAYTTSNTFTDENLNNGETYCYKIKSMGAYSVAGFIDPIINFSQEKCGIPNDDTAPCPPDFSVAPDCQNYSVSINWTNPNNACKEKDAFKYFINYKPNYQGKFSRIQEIVNLSDTNFTYQNFESIAGCYYVSAIDKYDNESRMIDSLCIENCPVYDLPNVFTPDGDGKNDVFKPLKPYRYIESVNTQIFNRWGRVVFETGDIDINWNGVDKTTNKICTEGVYFYVCKASYLNLKGSEIKLMQGFVELFRNNDTIPGTN